MSSRLSCNNEVRANIDIFKTYVKFERAIVVRSKSAKIIAPKSLIWK